MKVKDITTFLEQWAPLSIQEGYDNCGLIVGEGDQEVTQVLITLDVTEKVLDEAVANKCQLIIAHHPLIFSGIKKLGNSHWLERCIRKAIKSDIAIYAIHTNLDNISTGVNAKIASLLGLQRSRILRPKNGTLIKLETFVPTTDASRLASELYKAGAGQIGEYDECSFQSQGIGTFRPTENANPTIGSKGLKEEVNETKLEVLVPSYAVSNVLRALKENHPYEEVAYFLTALDNVNQTIGAGLIGELPTLMDNLEFLEHLKTNMQLSVVKQTHFISKTVKRVALCGGAGSFLLQDAIEAGADVFISSDFKYHDYFEANNQITILDIGHFESEVFTKELVYDVLKQKFANIAFRLSGVVTNPIIYS